MYSEALPGGAQVGAGRPQGSQGQVGKGCLHLRLHPQTPACSGPYRGKITGAHSGTGAPGPLGCACAAARQAVRPAGRRCPCPYRGHSRDGQQDDIQTTPARPLPRASVPDSCCVLHPEAPSCPRLRAESQGARRSQVHTAGPSRQRWVGGRSKSGSASGRKGPKGQKGAGTRAGRGWHSKDIARAEKT